MNKLIVIVMSIVVLQLAFGQGTAVAGDGTMPLGGGGAVIMRGSDGTLPLKLPSDGTLPLSLAGSATHTGGAPVAAQLTLSSVQTTPLPAGVGVSGCQVAGSDVTRHAATGQVTVGGVAHSVLGLCFDHGSNTLEVVGANNLSFAAVLPAPVPRELSGRLAVGGVHYMADLRAP